MSVFVNPCGGMHEDFPEACESGFDSAYPETSLCASSAASGWISLRSTSHNWSMLTPNFLAIVLGRLPLFKRMKTMTASSKLRLFGRVWIQTDINCSFLAACAHCFRKKLATSHAWLLMTVFARKHLVKGNKTILATITCERSASIVPNGGKIVFAIGVFEGVWLILGNLSGITSAANSIRSSCAALQKRDHCLPVGTSPGFGFPKSGTFLGGRI